MLPLLMLILMVVQDQVFVGRGMFESSTNTFWYALQVSFLHLSPLPCQPRLPQCPSCFPSATLLVGDGNGEWSKESTSEIATLV